MSSKRVIVSGDDGMRYDQKKSLKSPNADDSNHMDNNVGPPTINAIKDSLTLHRQKAYEQCTSHRELQPYKLPPIKCRPKKEDIRNAIKSLPSDWIPNKKKSKVIQKLVKRKEVDHEVTLEAMRNKMFEVNSNVEEDIRLLAVIYKEGFTATLKWMDESLKNLRAAYKKEGQLLQEHFNKALEDIKINYRKGRLKIYVLIQKLKLRENHRIGLFETFLQVAYKRLNEIAFKSPFEIQEFFVQEIQDINEITLNNLRHYQRLRLKLCLNLDNETRLRLQEVQVVKLNWVNYIKLSVFSRLNEQSLFGEQPPEKAGGSRKYKLDPMVMKLIRSPTMPKLDVDKLYEWINKVQSVINQIDWHARDIIRGFKSAVVTMFKSYFDDMKEIAENILKLGVIGEDPTAEGVKAEIRCPAITDLGRKFQQMLNQLQTMWDNIAKELHTELQETFIFFNTFANLWEAHIARINDAKHLAGKDVHNCMQASFLELCNEESNINIALDTLRQDPYEKNLDIGMASVIKYLDILVQLYNSNYEKECKVIEDKLMNLITCEGELHYAEIANFLVATEHTIVRDASEMSTFEDCDTVSILQQEIDTCYTQLTNIKNWRTKLYQLITDYLKICQEETISSAKVWIEKECDKFDVRRTISIEILHKSRYDRIKPVLYDIRLAELKEHSQRFERHQAGIEKKTDALIISFSEYETKYDREVEVFLNKSNDTKFKLAKAKNYSSVLSEAVAFKRISDNCVKILTSLDADFKKKCNETKYTILKSNLNYITSMKTFEEGGNFNPEEIKVATTELTKIEKVIQKILLTAVKQSYSKFQKCLPKVTMIQSTTEDILSKYKTELQYQDLLTFTLKDVHANIKREVHWLRSSRKSISASINDIKKHYGYFFKDLSDTNHIMQFRKELTDMLESTKNLRSIYVRPTPEVDSTFGNLDHLEENRNTDLLFSFAPIPDQTFLGKCRYIIYKSFSNIQTAAKTFYEIYKDSHFLTEDKILPTYNDFISEILPKYISYYCQCELFLLEEIQEFILMLDDITTYITDFCKRSLKEFKSKSMKEIRDIHHMVTRRIAEVRHEQENEFRYIQNKFLALHGYPGNRYMLDQLCEDMANFLNERVDVFMPSLECCTCDLEDMQKAFTCNLVKLNGIFTQILDDVLHACTRKEISENYLKGYTFLERLATVIAELPVSDSLLEFHAATQTLGGYGRKIPDWNSETDLSEMVFTKAVYNADSTTSVRRSGSLIDTQDASLYEVERLQIIIELQEGEEANLKVLEEWRESWNADVEQIKKLYTVKYDFTK